MSHWLCRIVGHRWNGWTAPQYACLSVAYCFGGVHRGGQSARDTKDGEEAVMASYEV
jgi:hypothetical protein